MNRTSYRGRFAPSPTGELHFGSLIAAVGSYLDAKANGGEWIVRIEDVDITRCRPEYETSILQTLEAFGFEWDGPVFRQSGRREYYRDVFESLKKKGFVYGCACTRKEIADFASGIDGAPVYPGTCRNGLPPGKTARAWRLRVPDRVIAFDDAIQGHQSQNLEKDVGDFILLRTDGLFAYQLAVAADDIAQEISHVVRGADLLASTPRQIWLYECLGEKAPAYAHLPLAVNEAGEKLSKQTRAKPIRTNDPAVPLRAALRFLNLHPDKTGSSLHDLWNWAIMNWSVENVPRKQTIKSPI
ncbi:tRNA glutamyl-Q(34) synthetase GluQRS [Oxalobacter paraformigenes]|uniref:Glutamyl-Q tRNA(Asp) synthetase n=1 Tax=Oxalobacter paraformigenes TaxID=556268 RepID=C3X2U3_9BURK|nr:tRNA glutamyl-Q(34) synthetase GluQRS [Oxalobacter paraformigenes]EEO27529.1 glutamyl-queuosine tRNA(Asp) synthetase [Oxalobacter paraformigenes]